jgi:hypothetical protein
MTRWDVFQLLAECLRPAVSSARPRIPDAPVPWEFLVEASGEHLVSPALGWCLQRDDRVPAEVSTCFETLLDLNRRRNTIILDGLEDALTALNSAGVTPVLLKGTAALADELYPDPGMRVMGDIDLLIPEMALRRAFDALDAAGFTGRTGRSQFDIEHHHLPLQVHSVSRVGIELHKLPVPRELHTLVDVSRCLRNAVSFEWRGLRMRMASPTDRVAHNVTHGQIIDGHYLRGVPRLRQLLELAALRARYRTEIDVDDLGHRFSRAGYSKVLSDTLLWSEALLERPDGWCWAEEHHRALDRLRSAVAHPQRQRWGVYRRLLARNARRLVQNPGFLFNVFNVRFWSLEFEGIRRRLGVIRW